LIGPKPDIDNFLKAALDAVTKVGGYWEDDHQIVWVTANKRWCHEGEEPHTTVQFFSQE
jgi:Holliday junction resolvase RusA-like endonuclease